MFIGANAHEQKGRKQDWAEAAVKLKCRPSRVCGELGLVLPITVPAWAELAEPPCPHLVVSLFRLL